MSYLPQSYYGQPQQAYNPPVGPPPANQKQLEEYDRVKRKSNILIIVVVIMVIVLIAMLIAVFVVGFRSTSSSSGTNSGTAGSLNINLIAKKTDETYTQDLANPSSTAFVALASATCPELQSVLTNKGYMIGGCTISSMTQASPTGVEMTTSIIVLTDGTKTDSEILLGMGDALVYGVTPPLEVIPNSIKIGNRGVMAQYHN